jgi:APA family basic amino acid/polyamine antiporter
MTGPRRELGLVLATSLVLGNVVGSGIFLLPASLAPYGGAGLLGWLVTSAGALCLAAVFSRLSRTSPAAGGPYAYARDAFGDFTGFLVAWAYWISLWTGNAAIAVALVSYLHVFWPALEQSPALGAAVCIGIVWTLCGINIAGVRLAGIVCAAATVIKILPLAAIGLAGLLRLRPEHLLPLDGTGAGLAPAVQASATLTLWAFLGIESATVPAQHVRDPQRTIPRATLLGTVAAAALYILASAAVMSVLPREALAGSAAPFADAARALWGDRAGYAVGAAAAVSCLGALNGWTLLAGQLPLAAATDGLCPAPFARLSRRGTPAAGIAIAGILVSAMVALNFQRGLVGMFTFIVLLATLANLVPYLFAALAGLRAPRRPDLRGGRARAGGVAIAAAAFLYSLWAIGGSGAEVLAWGVLLLLAAVPLFAALRWLPRRRVRP